MTNLNEQVQEMNNAIEVACEQAPTNEQSKGSLIKKVAKFIKWTAVGTASLFALLVVALIVDMSNDTPQEKAAYTEQAISGNTVESYEVLGMTNAGDYGLDNWYSYTETKLAGDYQEGNVVAVVKNKEGKAVDSVKLPQLGGIYVGGYEGGGLR